MTKTHLLIVFAAALAAAQVHGADDAAKKPAPKKAEAKKAEPKKAEAKSGGQSDKNVFQKAESGTGKFLNENKLWTGKK
jgi:hypothetical protein